MYSKLADNIKHYLEQGEEFAVVQVISRKAPSSGKPGDKAIILKDGSIVGWIGGGCVKGIAVKEALEAINDQRYRMVRISPELLESHQDENYINYKMTCHSGGSMELFIEPVSPSPHLIVLGKSDIAIGLSRMAVAAKFRVTVMGSGTDKEQFSGATTVGKIDFENANTNAPTFVIVSTQGDGDEAAVRQALQSNIEYVGFVASKKKAAKVKEYLQGEGVDKVLLDRLRSPVGLDINAKIPEEIAISILAEIVQIYRQISTEDQDQSAEQVAFDPDKFYLNPVCNIPISKESPMHIVEHKGHKVYFCCDGCKTTFDQNPDKYIEIIEKR